MGAIRARKHRSKNLRASSCPNPPGPLRASMNLDPKTSRNGGAPPTIHLEYIQNRAEAGDEDGVAAVEEYHRALFLNRHAGDLERHQQQGKLHEDRLVYLETRLRDARSKLAGLDPLSPVDVNGERDVRPTAPWNLWDRAMFLASLLGIASLLIFGVLNVSFNLLESGLVTFVESPVRAYFWAALLPVGALAVKVGWDFLQSPRRRERYLWTCLLAGITGVLVWVAAYASVYPTLSRSTDEQIAALTVFDADEAGTGLGELTAAGAKRIDMIIVTAQAIAEIFLSAVLGMYMTMIYTRHRPVRLARNPGFDQWDEERRSLEDAVAQERAALASARGGESQLKNQLSAFVAFARSMFEKETAVRRNESHRQRLLLDQISTQLRAQLETVGSRGATAPAPERPTLAFTPENGK